MTPDQGRTELVRLQRELDDVRRLHADLPSTRARTPAGQAALASGWVFPAGLLLGVAVIGLIVMAAFFAGESVGFLLGGGLVTAVAGLALVLVVRRKILPHERARKVPLLALQARRAALIDEADAVWAALADRPLPPGDQPVALPRSRQPRPWAELMSGRFRVGRPPQEVLRALPADASPATVWFHRNVGPSGLLALGLVAVVVALTTAQVLVRL